MSCSNLRVSGKQFDRRVEGLDQSVENVTSLGDLLRLTQGVNDALVLGHPHVQVSLQSLLRLADQEEPDLLGDSVTHIPEDKAKVLIDTLTEVSHDGAASHRRSIWRHILLHVWRLTLTRRHTLWLLSRLLSWLLSNLHLILIWGLLMFLEVSVVREMVVQLRVKDSLYETPRVVSEFLENLNNHIHHDWSEGRES